MGGAGDAHARVPLTRLGDEGAGGAGGGERRQRRLSSPRRLLSFPLQVQPNPEDWRSVCILTSLPLKHVPTYHPAVWQFEPLRRCTLGCIASCSSSSSSSFSFSSSSSASSSYIAITVSGRCHVSALVVGTGALRPPVAAAALRPLRQ